MADNFTPIPVKGLKSDNTSAPTNDNLPVLAALVSATSPALTSGNESKLSLDASGNLRVILSSNSVVIGSKTNNSSAPTADNIGALVGIATTASPTYTTGNLVALSLDTSGNLRVGANITSVAGNAVTTGNGVTSSGSQRITIASDNTPFTVKISKDANANALTNPIYNQNTNGTTTVDFGSGAITSATPRVVVANDQFLPVSKNTSSNAANNAIFTTLSDGTNSVGTVSNPLYVASDGIAGSARFSYLTQTSLAAGTSVTLSASAITTGKIGQLYQVVFSSSVRVRCEVQSFDGNTATTLAVLFAESDTLGRYMIALPSAFTRAGGATSVFRVVLKNMDNVLAADVYATIEWLEI